MHSVQVVTTVSKTSLPNGMISADRAVAWWQHRLTPCWKCLGGGCHLDRKIDDLITAAGFHIEKLDAGYMQGRNPFAFMYEGVARPAN